MSRRNQATRRRSYGRRLHEVRQRHEGRNANDWSGERLGEWSGGWSAELADTERPKAGRADEVQLPDSMETGPQ